MLPLLRRLSYAGSRGVEKKTKQGLEMNLNQGETPVLGR